MPISSATGFRNFLLTAFRKPPLTHFLTYFVSSFRINRGIPVAPDLKLNGSSSLGDRRRIDFLIAGTQKGGTSALDTYLRNHPEICMASRKEAHFFDDERYFQPEQNNYHEYHSLFKPERSHRILGESTPVYMYWKPVPARIWRYNPGMKIIIILRNPIERAYSQWNMQHERNIESLSFWDALQAESQRCMQAYPHQHRIYSYMDRGFYLQQLERIWYYFPKHQTLILKNEDLRANPKETLNSVCRFLGVSCFTSVEPQNVFSGSYGSTMSIKAREYLINVFDAEIRNLERVLELDFHDWLQNSSKTTVGAQKSSP